MSIQTGTVCACHKKRKRERERERLREGASPRQWLSACVGMAKHLSACMGLIDEKGVLLSCPWVSLGVQAAQNRPSKLLTLVQIGSGGLGSHMMGLFLPQPDERQFGGGRQGSLTGGAVFCAGPFPRAPRIPPATLFLSSACTDCACFCFGG
jgi:hypothetical protein